MREREREISPEKEELGEKSPVTPFQRESLGAGATGPRLGMCSPVRKGGTERGGEQLQVKPASHCSSA